MMEDNQISEKRNLKRKNPTNDSSINTTKRSKLNELIFYDGNRHPAAVLHDLRPDINCEKYDFQLEEIAPKQKRFRCSLIIEQNDLEPIRVMGFGRSKQLAKNMAAQQALMKLYPTYRPPDDAILTEEYDMHQQSRFIPTRPPSLYNDPKPFIDSIRKHLTTKSMALKTPLQLFNELFINNQRLNSSTRSKNRIDIIKNEENLVVIRVTAMDQQFWSVSVAKNVAQNDACQQAIESLCNVSFRQAKDEFLRALQSIDNLTLSSDIIIDDNNNNTIHHDNNHSEEQTTTTPEVIHLSEEF